MDETSLQVSAKVREFPSWSDSLDLDAVLTDEFGRAARAEEAESESLELLRERKEVGLVVDRQEGCPLALSRVAGHTDRRGSRRHCGYGVCGLNPK